jgi:formate-dependent nitrite reductase membrane component NrfD
MSFVHQTVWGWPIAAYLFLGGLGGGVAALSYWLGLEMAGNPAAARSVRRFGMAAGLASLVLGTLLLVYDLGDPAHLWHIFGNPRSWIFWGVVIITVFMVATAAYLVPEVTGDRTAVPWVARLQRAQPVLSLVAAITGVLVALYTGFLVSMAPAIPFWDTPALPLLFLVSALSTASALLMLQVAWDVGRLPHGHDLLRRLETADIWLIGVELLVLAAFLNYSRMSPAAARLSRAYLLSNPGFVIGFFICGLLLPWGLEIALSRRGRAPAALAAAWGETAATRAAPGTEGGPKSRPGPRWGVAATPALTSLLVLMGGFLLRWYVLAAGIFGYPFPRV